MNKPMLGVIGGLGPMATVHFMKLVVDMTDAISDQQHIPMLVANYPQIPDRTAYILDPSKPNPIVPMVRCGEFLEKSGATQIAIPCITAHSFHGRLQAALAVPIVNGVEETVDYLKGHGIQKAGVMATEGTIQTKLFSHALEAKGMAAIIPDKEHQTLVTDLIYKDIKAGKKPDEEKFKDVEEHLLSRDAEVILLGCTELSLVDKTLAKRSLYLDVLEVLARTCVKRFGKLRLEYDTLLGA